jgi:hypothetical protein
VETAVGSGSLTSVEAVKTLRAKRRSDGGLYVVADVRARHLGLSSGLRPSTIIFADGLWDLDPDPSGRLDVLRRPLSTPIVD